MKTIGISNNSLHELLTLYTIILQEINKTYSHVSDYVPKELKQAINKEYNYILDEFKEREYEF